MGRPDLEPRRTLAAVTVNPTTAHSKGGIMKDNTIEILGSHGRAFFLEIWTPSTATNLKFWRCDRTRYQDGDGETIDKGFIRFNCGDAFLADRRSPVFLGYCFSGNSETFKDLFLGEPGAVDGHDYELFKWGMVLYDYVDVYGVKDSGRGVVKQNWVLALEPGDIWWKKATIRDMIEVGAKRLQDAATN
jgi:hypothetical protein